MNDDSDSLPYPFWGWGCFVVVDDRKKVSAIMARVTLYKDSPVDCTTVPNIFIDQYMKDANDAQIKIYLYLLRMLKADESISVSGIADCFNHTEKDVLRSLKYWEKQGLLDLDFDEEKNLIGIHLRDLSAPVRARKTRKVALTAGDEEEALPVSVVEAVPSRGRDTESAPVASPAPREAESVSDAAPAEDPFAKPSYSLDQLREFKNRKETPQLLFIAESYIGKPLTPSEIRTVFFFKDRLQFSDDLIDYLLQYCVDRGKKDFRYIEKVAISWAQEGITTPKKAREYSTRYDKSVYTIMNGLGRSSTPTSKEMEYINRWTKEYGFSTDIILEACDRTVLATDRHRFEYAEGILSSWREANVRHKSDIRHIDELYQKKRSASAQATKQAPASNNRFNQFSQNSYDFDMLEKKLLSN